MSLLGQINGNMLFDGVILYSRLTRKYVLIGPNNSTMISIDISDNIVTNSSGFTSYTRETVIDYLINQHYEIISEPSKIKSQMLTLIF